MLYKTRQPRKAICRRHMPGRYSWGRLEVLEERRLLAAGDLDPTFGIGGLSRVGFVGETTSSKTTNAMALQADGKILLAGQSGAVYRYNSNGSLDAGFGLSGLASVSGYVRAMTVQPDGKIITVGQAHNVTRFNADGSLDTSFANHGLLTISIGEGLAVAEGVALQADGKIVVSGVATIASTQRFAVMRLQQNGALDPSFGIGGVVTTPIGAGNSQGRNVRIQADGKIVVVGFTLNGAADDFAVVRYDASGSLDASFGSGGVVVTAIGDSYDNAWDLAIQADGKIVAAGYARIGFQYGLAVVRYHTNGALDSSFDSDGKVTTMIGNSAFAYRMTLQNDGKILVAGFAGNDFAIVRYQANGALDASFDSDGIAVTSIGASSDYAWGIAVADDMKIVVGGYFNVSPGHSMSLVRYQANGSLDPSFGSDGIVTTSIGHFDDYAQALAVQADGKIVLAGYTRFGSTNDEFALSRLHADGTVDSSFGANGRIITPFNVDQDHAKDVAIQGDGKIVAAGYSRNGSQYTFAVARYTTEGTLDPTFDGDGKLLTAFGTQLDQAEGVAIQSDGKIVVVGYAYFSNSYYIALARYNSDGSLDGTFDSDGKVTTAVGNATDVGKAIEVLPDGRIIVAGYANNGSNDDFAVLRYHANGTLDASFNSTGKVTTPIGGGHDRAEALAIQSDGKIVVAGSAHNGTDNDFALLRYNVDGSLDTSFGNGGKVTIGIGDNGRSVAIQNDGKIVVVGQAFNGAVNVWGVVRLMPDGALDQSFGNQGIALVATGSGQDIAIQRDGSLLVAGWAWNGSNYDFGVARIESGHSAVVNRQLFYNDSSFDGLDSNANGADDAAIATNKSALLPGTGRASFANYSTSAAGLNGVMVDLRNAADPAGISLTDFEFRIGNSDDLGAWDTAPAPMSIAVRDAGNGVTRVTLVWNNRAISNNWLEVRMKATAATGLSNDDVFYFGNAIGDTGDSPADAGVNGTDFLAVRGNPAQFLNPAGIENRYDFNRDGRVNAVDLLVVRDHATELATSLKLISPAPALAANFGLAGLNAEGEATARGPVSDEQIARRIAPHFPVGEDRVERESAHWLAVIEDAESDEAAFDRLLTTLVQLPSDVEIDSLSIDEALGDFADDLLTAGTTGESLHQVG